MIGYWGCICRNRKNTVQLQHTLVETQYHVTVTVVEIPSSPLHSYFIWWSCYEFAYYIVIVICSQMSLIRHLVHCIFISVICYTWFNSHSSKAKSNSKSIVEKVIKESKTGTLQVYEIGRYFAGVTLSWVDDGRWRWTAPWHWAQGIGEEVQFIHDDGTRQCCDGNLRGHLWHDSHQVGLEQSPEKSERSKVRWLNVTTVRLE